ncbi:metallophosphoesterase family protein [Cytobacillus solani]|uniref:Phosphoesterase n=1 Tax=Cytobacillus solani TaxID=1637975 RepID=A0A0Q3VHQ7_9BACI|nr:metallophosphoesterase [Cytobacillus solani]KOP83643.1 metallophosphatase [Bacillus sp. FJAT-21945]KQL20719.1 metallophosphatase [Cytobacillus solani]USK53957.1 metallophosphoesterase [Cytobacillus solani]
MKILIVSDSHGLTEELLEIKARYAHEVQMMIHCGDSELQADEEALENFHVVQGNCDFIGTFPEDLIKELGGLRVFVTHGHRYGVKSTLLNLSLRAQEAAANIVCFGHSHFLGAEMIEGIMFINPGSIRLPRGRTEKTFVILELSENEMKLHVHDLTHGKLDDLTQVFSLPKRD